MPLVLLLVCCVVNPVFAQEPGVTITLRPSVTIDQPMILLPQVADISGPADMLTALNQVSLGSAPVPGLTRTVVAAYVRLRLKRYGFDPTALTITGDVVTVRRVDKYPRVPLASSSDCLTDMPVVPPEISPDIHRGDEVQIAVQSGGVTITLSGRALQDGSTGESLKVHIPNTHRTIEATVSGPGQLILHL